MANSNLLSHKHEHPQREPNQACETPKREARDIILCTSDPIHINFLQSWMAIGQETPLLEFVSI